MSNAYSQSASGKSDSSPIYLAGQSDLRETGRAIGITLLGVEPSAPALFLPAAAGEVDEAWTDWVKTVFEGGLGEKFVAIYTAAGEMRNRRIVELDGEIDSHLSEEERLRSLSAAAPFFEGTNQIRRLPQWTKFVEKIESDATPGHVTSLFALRSAVFHLPLLPALVSYLFFEWKSGIEASGRIPEVRLSPAGFQAGFPEGIEAAKRIFVRGWDSNRFESI